MSSMPSHMPGEVVAPQKALAIEFAVFHWTTEFGHGGLCDGRLVSMRLAAFVSD